LIQSTLKFIINKKTLRNCLANMLILRMYVLYAIQRWVYLKKFITQSTSMAYFIKKT